MGLGNGVVGGLLSVAETIENDQQTDLGHVRSNKANCDSGILANFLLLPVGGYSPVLQWIKSVHHTPAFSTAMCILRAQF